MGKGIPKQTVSRRALLQASAGLAAAVGLSKFAAAAGHREPTPEIADHDEPTPAETEGPFFKPKSPERKSLREGVKGSSLVVEGQVLSTNGKPIKGALVDFWHCDGEGVYDNAGFKLRGHQYTDKQGRYRLETVVPGVYPGRARHIHVKAQAPNGPVLTTQLYFPGEERNHTDSLYTDKLALTLSMKDGAKLGLFDFVLRT
jgi:protocatechuate 3,4-dioxygenase beta subunit